jgi:hypothetical protein
MPRALFVPPGRRQQESEGAAGNGTQAGVPCAQAVRYAREGRRRSQTRVPSPSPSLELLIKKTGSDQSPAQASF